MELGGGAASAQKGKTMENIKRISVKEAKASLDAQEPILFVDSRNGQAWAESKSKIPGAIRVPADRVSEYVSQIPKGRRVIAYCT